MKRLIVLVGLLIASTAQATNYPGFRALKTDSFEVIATTPSTVRPLYRKWAINTLFNVKVNRVADDIGRSLLPTRRNGSGAGAVPGGTWIESGRHHYSKDQAWSNDGKWFVIEGQSANTPSSDGCAGASELILNVNNNYYPYSTTNYCASLTGRASLRGSQTRWWPRKQNPTWRVGLIDSSSANQSFVVVEDVINCRRIKTIGPLAPDLYNATIGESEGNLSESGRWLLVGKVSGSIASVQLVDIDSMRVGDVQYLTCGAVSTENTDHFTITPLGNKVLVAWHDELHRVYDADTLANPTWGAITPRAMTVSFTSPVFGALPKDSGWVHGIKHVDIGIDPDTTQDYAMGVNKSTTEPPTSCEVAKVNLATGYTRCILNESIGGVVSKENWYHGSCRATARRGWILLSGVGGSAGSQLGKRYYDEIAFLKTDGSQMMQRIMQSHSNRICYRTEQHASPNWDGTAVTWASNWGLNGSSPPPNSKNSQAYIARFDCQAPRGLGNLVSTSQTTTQIAVRWQYVSGDTIDQFAAPVKVELKYATTNTPFTDANFATTGTTFSSTLAPGVYGGYGYATITGLTQDTRYNIAARATSACGTVGPITNSMCIYTLPSSGTQQTCSGSCFGCKQTVD